MPPSPAASRLLLTIVLTGAAPVCSGAYAQTVFDSWSSVAIPLAPELLPVTIDAELAALLILDVNADACSHRPCCVRSMPHMQHVLADARSHHMLAECSTSTSAPAAPVPEPRMPMPNDQSVSSSTDKFLPTDLAKILTNRGIKTVIVVGTTAEGTVLYTASAAALRKLTVVVPGDRYSSNNPFGPFGELTTSLLLESASVSVLAHVTLTRMDMIPVHDASPPKQSASVRTDVNGNRANDQGGSK